MHSNTPQIQIIFSNKIINFCSFQLSVVVSVAGFSLIRPINFLTFLWILCIDGHYTFIDYSPESMLAFNVQWANFVLNANHYFPIVSIGASVAWQWFYFIAFFLRWAVERKWLEKLIVLLLSFDLIHYSNAWRSKMRHIKRILINAEKTTKKNRIARLNGKLDVATSSK